MFRTGTLDSTQMLLVGGESMISTSNYEARKFGVRSAMPGFIAKQLCKVPSPSLHSYYKGPLGPLAPASRTPRT